MRKDPELSDALETGFTTSLLRSKMTKMLESAALNPELDPDVVMNLTKATLHTDRHECEEVLLSYIRKGMAPEDLIDRYIPQVAQLLGDYWCEDSLGFAEVTIAVARLQGNIRALDQLTRRSLTDQFNQPSVLLVVAPDSYHTLGAMVVLSRFRRLGCTVRLMIGTNPKDLAHCVENSAFDMVALSSSGCEKLDLLRLLVENIRSGGGATPPIVVGGAILDKEPDAHILIGADYSAREPSEALTLCGLMITTLGASNCASAG